MATPLTLTAAECEKLLYQLLYLSNILKQSHPGIRNHTIAVLMLDAGLRVGEVVQMRGFDLYFNYLPVTSITIRPDIAKNKTERIIPVTHRLRQALKNHAEAEGGFDNIFSDIFVFRQHKHECHITTRQVERFIRKAAMKSLGRPIHPHVLRHTFATRLMRKTNTRVVQELLGHKHMTSTQIYTHPDSEDFKKAINSIENGAACSHPSHQGLPICPDVSDQLNAARANRNMR